MKTKTIKSGLSLLVLVAALCMVPSVPAQTGSDAALLRAAQAKVSAEKFAKDVQVGVSAGVIQLDGTVATIEQREHLWKAVTKIEGSAGVKNNLRIAQGRTDKQVAEEAAHRVRMYPYYSIFDDVEVEADGGVLTVTGQVITPWRKSDIGELMKSVTGATEVRNNIEVLPVSPFDDQIRLRVARAVFGSLELVRYGLSANPSIHIIVKNGNVRLTGFVQNAVDKALAERAARFAATYFGLENDLRIG